MVYAIENAMSTHNRIPQSKCHLLDLSSMAQLRCDRCCRQCKSHTPDRGEVVLGNPIERDGVAIFSSLSIMNYGAFLND